MNTFSFRAEFMQDAVAFSAQCVLDGFRPSGVYKFDTNITDVAVEVHVEASLEALRDVLRKIPDSHVMIETLRQVPLAENSLERDRSIE